MFLKKMKILNFLREKVKLVKPKPKVNKAELIDKANWLDGNGPQTD